jgi:hypothetical protein
MPCQGSFQLSILRLLTSVSRSTSQTTVDIPSELVDAFKKFKSSTKANRAWVSASQTDPCTSRNLELNLRFSNV